MAPASRAASSAWSTRASHASPTTGARLRAWAWGASRALDYLETDPAVDAKRAVIEGVSRYGKASLVTMAYEPRFAIGFIGSSGMGGAALHRGGIGRETRERRRQRRIPLDGGQLHQVRRDPLTAKDLPVDAHELIALCAPRPLFIGAGNPEQG